MGDKMPKKEPEDKKGMENVVLITQVGINMVTPILLGLYIGKKLDGWLNTSPFLLLTFLVLGIGASFTNLFKTVEKSQGNKKGK
jgi:ATP synthase protein I